MLLEISNVNNIVNSKYPVEINNLFLGEYVYGYHVSHGTGELLENENYCVSDFISVDPDTIYTGNYSNHIVYYDANRKYISGTNLVYTASTPHNCAYVRFDWNFKNISTESIYFIKGNNTDNRVNYLKDWVKIKQSNIDDYESIANAVHVLNDIVKSKYPINHINYLPGSGNGNIPTTLNINNYIATAIGNGYEGGTDFLGVYVILDTYANLINKNINIFIKNYDNVIMNNFDIMISNNSWNPTSTNKVFKTFSLEPGDDIKYTLDNTIFDDIFSATEDPLRLIIRKQNISINGTYNFSFYVTTDDIDSSKDTFKSTSIEYVNTAKQSEFAEESNHAIKADMANFAKSISQITNLEAVYIASGFSGYLPISQNTSEYNRCTYVGEDYQYFIAIKVKLFASKLESIGKTIKFIFNNIDGRNRKIGINCAEMQFWGPSSKIFWIGSINTISEITFSADLYSDKWTDDDEVWLIISDTPESNTPSGNYDFAFIVYIDSKSDDILKLPLIADDIRGYNLKEMNEKLNTFTSSWSNKVWACYGDSITAISNGNGLSLGWSKYVNNIHNFSMCYGRGVGGQKYAWGTAGGSATFINADGTYNSRNDSYNKDTFSGEAPNGTTVCRGAFSSWDRITHMFPEDIKDQINLIVIMGGTNDGNDDTPLSWVDSSSTDPEWANSEEYKELNGDYNISTLRGGIASCIMKMQAWMPNAIIVVATPLSGRGETGKNKTNLDIVEYHKSIIIKEMCDMMSIPCIDVYGTCGINPWNRKSYIQDSVHPYLEDGKKMLGRAVAMGLIPVLPK